jgi:hypothetical protein
MVDFSGLGVSEVTKYRAYVMGEDGFIAHLRAFICGNDADATVWAKQLGDGHDIELWSGDRLVIRLNSTGRPGAVTHEVIDGRMVPKIKPTPVGGVLSE